MQSENTAVLPGYDTTSFDARYSGLKKEHWSRSKSCSQKRVRTHL